MTEDLTMEIIRTALQHTLGLPVEQRDGGMGGDWFEWKYAGLTHWCGNNGEVWGIAIYQGDPEQADGFLATPVTVLDLDLDYDETDAETVAVAVASAIRAQIAR